MRIFLGLTIGLAALPAWGFEGRYEGEAKFVVGRRFCPVQGPALTFEVSQNGKVIGGAKTQNQAVPFSGTVGPDGKLTATYKAALDTDPMSIEAMLTDKLLEGFTQSPNCKYKISFERQ